MPNLDWLISVDDHLIEPPDLWLERAPSKYRERVPQTRVVNGAEHWYFDGGVPYGFVGKYIACAGLKPEEFSPEPAAYSWMRPGYMNSAARIEDMDADGVLASACFPSVIGICGQKFFEAKDKDLALFCIRTYNDWVIDEWAGGAPGRFIPLVLLPLWDPRLSTAEIERCAKKGAKGISFTENPYLLGLPSLHDDSGYWDPVFAAVNETKLPLCIHFGSTSKVITSSPDAPQLVPASLVPINLATAMVDWIWSGLLARYPNIKLVLAEGGIGWIPYMLERLKHLHVVYKWAKDNDWRTNLMTGEVTKREKGLDLDTPPVEVFKRHGFTWGGKWHHYDTMHFEYRPELFLATAAD